MRKLIISLAGLFTLIVSSILAYNLHETSWFTLLLLYTIVLSFNSSPRFAFAFTISVICYTVIFSLYVVGDPPTIEIFLVSIVWIVAGMLPSVMVMIWEHTRLRTEYYRTILEASPEAIITLEPDNSIREWNPGAERLFHYTKEEVIGRNIDILLSGNDESSLENARELTRQVEAGGSLVPPLERVRYTREGSPIHVLISGAQIYIHGEIRGIAAIYIDIEQRRQAEMKIKRMLAEKETLLHEVHHRIKNHMNTIYAMLGIHIAQHGDDVTATELTEIQNRVGIMQNIYQKLYISDNVGRVDAMVLIMEVIQAISDSLLLDDSITIESHLDDIEVSTEQSFPLAIIVNELLTNAIKYAFPDHVSGTIRVSMSCDSQDFIHITVGDTGRGLPAESVSGFNYGFGLTLVAGYAEQYGGALNVVTGTGTKFEVTMNRELPASGSS